MSDRTLKALLIALFLLAIPALASAPTGGPQPPCGSTVHPMYSAPEAPPFVKLWRAQELERLQWTPPACLGWTSSSRSELIVAMAGSFVFPSTTEQLVARIGAISTLRAVRYWSVTDKRWRPLVVDASALSGPDPNSRRPDFVPAEMASGSERYYLENDRRSGKIVYRMTVRERSAVRVVIAMENVTRVRLFFVPLFEPGALQSVEFVERIAPGVWACIL